MGQSHALGRCDEVNPDQGVVAGGVWMDPLAQLLEYLQICIAFGGCRVLCCSPQVNTTGLADGRFEGTYLRCETGMEDGRIGNEVEIRLERRPESHGARRLAQKRLCEKSHHPRLFLQK